MKWRQAVYLIKISRWDFPGGPVVKNPPANAGDMNSIPGQGTKIPHATQCDQKNNEEEILKYPDTNENKGPMSQN